MHTAKHIGIALGLALAILFVDFGTKSAMAQEVQVEALVSETTIGVEESVNFTLEIKGVDFNAVETPQAPATEGLVLVQPTPFTQRNVSIVNGKMTQSVGYQWSYRPVKEGNARILPVSVTVNGKTYQTQPVRLTVVPQAQRPQRRGSAGNRAIDPFGRPLLDTAPDEESQSSVGERDIFIRAVPSARRAYQNQQVTIEYQLFFRSFIQPRHSRLADSWDAEGFWREELDVEARPMPRATVENGLRYNSIVLKRVAVFPTRSGELNVDPLRIETEVFAPRNPNDPFGRRFFSLRNPYETIERASPRIQIESQPLPDGAPDGFTGAVGRYEMDAQITSTEVEVGEPVQVTVRLTGTGNLAMLEGPQLNAPGIFETYDPEVTTSINSSGRQVRGSKTFTYLLVPRSNGTFEIPPIQFAFFDPTSEQYRTLRSDPMTIRATGDAMMTIATSTTASGLPVDDIARPLTEAAWARFNPRPLHRNPWTYGLLALPLMLVGLTLVYRRHVTRLATDTAYARNRRAHPLARKHLKQATALLQSDKPRAFYEELERAVLGFIGNRINVAELALTRPQLDERLAAAGLEQGPRDTLQAFLKTCDAARFAPDRPSRQQMQTSLDEANHLIVTLDAAFSRQPDEAASE